jgi:hypothetical protein
MVTVVGTGRDETRVDTRGRSVLFGNARSHGSQVTGVVEVLALPVRRKNRKQAFQKRQLLAAD